MSQPKKIVDLKDYASKLLSEIDEEVKQKNEQIERLRAEVEELQKQKTAIEQILASIDNLASAKQPNITVKAQVELPKEEKAAPKQDDEQKKVEPIIAKSPQSSGSHTGNDAKDVPAQQPQQQRAGIFRPFNGERKWEPIVVNNTEYASYSVSQGTIYLAFKFGVPADSKYVRGFIIDKYLQKMKEEASERVAKGEVKESEAFSFEVKTNEKGEIVEIKISNFAHDQLQDLLNKIKWFVASEVRDLRAKGRLT